MPSRKPQVLDNSSQHLCGVKQHDHFIKPSNHVSECDSDSHTNCVECTDNETGLGDAVMGLSRIRSADRRLAFPFMRNMRPSEDLGSVCRDFESTCGASGSIPNNVGSPSRVRLGFWALCMCQKCVHRTMCAC